MGVLDSLKGLFKGGASTTKKIDVEGRFQRMRTSAIGTMSNFFVAHDHEHGDRVVGVKVLDLEKVELFESRFKSFKKPSEGAIALGMNHPNIVETYEAGVSLKGQPVIIMEFIDGPSLQTIIVKRDEAAVRGKRLSLIRQMAEAIRYVHSREFIHRDICPRNFICKPGCDVIKLIDFGLTLPAMGVYLAPGNRTGTPLYMSPEVVRRKATDKRVDIFSFGVTAYCLCTFEHPWQDQVVTGKAALQHDTTPPQEITELVPEMDTRLARAIMSALEPKVETRTPTMEQFLASIQTLQLDY